MRLKQVILVCSIVGLVGCGSILGPQKKRGSQLYQIVDNTADSLQLGKCANVNTGKSIYVSTPDIATPYGDYKMYYMTESYVVSSYAYSQWATPVIDMIKQAELQSVVGSCLFKSVSGGNTVVSVDYRLITSIRMIRHEMIGGSTNYKAHIIIFNELVNVKKGDIVNSFIFDETKPTDGTPLGFVKSSSELTSDYDAVLVKWLDQHIKSSKD